MTLPSEAGFGRLAGPHVLAAIPDDRGLAPRHIIDLAIDRARGAIIPAGTA